MSNIMSEDLPFAYTFQCDLTSEEIQARLNANGPWTWLGGDSEYDGLYIRAVPELGSKLRILGETPPHYVIEIDFIPSLAENWSLEELHKFVIDDLLPSLGATNVVNAQ